MAFNHKKFGVLALALAVVLVLQGCGGNGGNDKKETKDGKTETTKKPDSGSGSTDGKTETTKQPVSGSGSNDGKTETPQKPDSGSGDNDGKPDNPTKLDDGSGSNDGNAETTTPQIAAFDDEAPPEKTQKQILQEKIEQLEEKEVASCQEKCDLEALYGRWDNGRYGHSCWQNVQDEMMLVCTCTHSETPPDNCEKPSSEISADKNKAAPSAMLADSSKAVRAPPSAMLHDSSKVSSSVYTEHVGKNCLPSKGAKFGERDSAAPEGLSLLQCQERCNDDANCDCVVYAKHAGKCWKRESCDLKQCVAAKWTSVHVKDEASVALFEAATEDRNVVTDASRVEESSEKSPAPADNSLVDVQAHEKGSPRETVHKFCDAKGLKEMRGGGQKTPEEANDAEETDGSGQSHQVESAILADIARELEKNNVDKMAKEIFTFYLCVRWVPDDTFAEIVQQELAAQIIKNVTGKANPHQAIAELYQQYKFVPLLCSQNLEVFRETDDEDHTYFRKFQKNVKTLSSWVTSKKDSPVGKKLASVDKIFCGDEPMNSRGCDMSQRIKDAVGPFTKLFGFGWPTRSDNWDSMHDLFSSFDGDEGTAEWKSEVKDWKRHFPYHSFIDKPGGMPVEASPNAGDRILVCFGKRVGSEMHRRPNGNHILTDQNNIGCHGWWSAEEAGQMLDRIVALWKPPTCQMADMVYTMKREILMMFKNMNEKLFDALPTMLMDEEMDKAGLLDKYVAGPGVFQRREAQIGGETFVDGMRISSNVNIRYMKSGEVTTEEKCKWGTLEHTAFWEEKPSCRYFVDKGTMGTVKIPEQNSQFASTTILVFWDGQKSSNPEPTPAKYAIIRPHTWKMDKGLAGYASDLVAGFKEINSQAQEIFGAVFGMNKHNIKKYNNLAAMMSDSVSKWIVCPVSDDTDFETLDSHLGVEDAAFKDFRKEAYAKWTGYNAKIPGEECETANYFPSELSAAKACSISELHADHTEKYTLNIETKETEQFICPIKPPLVADEQLTILEGFKNTCFLRLTEEQQRQYNWIYQGKYPARKQNDRKDNVPSPEYELVKLMNVPGGGEDSEVSLGRYCSVEELLATPRFCHGPVLQNPWSTVEEMAEALKDAVSGTYGAGASALAGAVSTYREGLAKNRTKEEWALTVGEATWSGLTGVGRLLKSATASAAVALDAAWTHHGRRVGLLETELFATEESGSLLHSMSFQRGIGNNGLTSNAKDRYDRYVVSYPCGDFDPGAQFASRRKWGDVVVRLVREAHLWHGSNALDRKVLETSVRAEALLFYRENKQTSNDTWFDYSVGMRVEPLPDEKPVECKGDKGFIGIGSSCEPKKHCTWQGETCAIRSDEGWWALHGDTDKQHLNGKSRTLGDKTSILSLRRTFGGLAVTGQAPVEDLKGLHMKLFCGEKQEFGKTTDIGVVPTPTENLRACLQRGIKQNARLRAASPWKLFFPDEVVVIAVFEAIAERHCEVKAGTKTSQRTDLREKLCPNGLTSTPDLSWHLQNDQKGDGSSFLQTEDGDYVGIHTGAGFPKGTPKEVILRPEDILEAVDEI